MTGRDQEAAVNPDRLEPAVMTFPSDLEIAVARTFDAPIASVFAVLTEPDHVRAWGATPPDRMTECSIDLRVGGDYHFSLVTGDGAVFSFDGTYLEIDPPVRTVETWLFDGWPDAPAVESWQLEESGASTTVTMTLAFADKAGRDRYPANAENVHELAESNGVLAGFEAIAQILRGGGSTAGTTKGATAR